jgi:hypothetical protein
VAKVRVANVRVANVLIPFNGPRGNQVNYEVTCPRTAVQAQNETGCQHTTTSAAELLNIAIKMLILFSTCQRKIMSACTLPRPNGATYQCANMFYSHNPLFLDKHWGKPNTRGCYGTTMPRASCFRALHIKIQSMFSKFKNFMVNFQYIFFTHFKEGSPPPGSVPMCDTLIDLIGRLYSLTLRTQK